MITIKISEFKPDSEGEEDEEDEEEISVEVADGFEEEVADEVRRSSGWSISPQVPRRSLELTPRSEGERPNSAIPLVTCRATEAAKLPKSGGSSPSLEALQQNGKDSPSPPPIRPTPPPRVRKKEGGMNPPRTMRAAPPPPPKPKILVNVRTSRSDMNLASSSTSSSPPRMPRSATTEVQDSSAAGIHRSRRS